MDNPAQGYEMMVFFPPTFFVSGVWMACVLS